MHYSTLTVLFSLSNCFLSRSTKATPMTKNVPTFRQKKPMYNHMVKEVSLTTTKMILNLTWTRFWKNCPLTTTTASTLTIQMICLNPHMMRRIVPFPVVPFVWKNLISGMIYPVRWIRHFAIMSITPFV